MLVQGSCKTATDFEQIQNLIQGATFERRSTIRWSPYWIFIGLTSPLVFRYLFNYCNGQRLSSRSDAFLVDGIILCKLFNVRSHGGLGRKKNYHLSLTGVSAEPIRNLYTRNVCWFSIGPRFRLLLQQNLLLMLGEDWRRNTFPRIVPCRLLSTTFRVL